MACSVNSQTIRNGIVNDATDSILKSGQFIRQGKNLVRVASDPISRLPEDSEKGRDGVVKEATLVLRGYEGSDQEDMDIIEAQQDALRTWAESNDRWLEDIDLLGERIGAGDEAQVFRQGDKVFKVMNDQFSPSPLSHLDRIAMTNSVVENAVPVELVGFTEDDGEFKVVVSQPFTEGEPLESRKAVRAFMSQNGWEDQGGDNYTKGDYLIMDLRPDNIFVKPDGEFALYDVVITLNTEDEDFGGTAQFNSITSTSILNKVNDEYGETVVTEQDGLVQINPSQELVGSYLDAYRADTASEQILADITREPSRVRISPTQAMKVNQLLTKLGVKVDNIILDGMSADIDAVALPLQALVAHAQGHDDKLMEEAYHIAVEILEVNHPGLLNQMMSEITKLPIYQEVYNQYSGNPQYQKADGKPDLRKIKKEAIAKQLVSETTQPEKVVNWWVKVKNFIANLVGTSGINLTPFRETLEMITRGNLGTVRNTLLKNERYLLSKDISPENVAKIIEIASSDLSDDDVRSMISQLVPNEEFYSLSSATKSTKTKLDTPKPKPDVLTAISDKLAQLFGSTVSREFVNALDLFKNSPNSEVKVAINDIIRRYVKPDGTIRTTPLPVGNTSLTRTEYDKLESMITLRLGGFPDAQVLVGTHGADLIIIDDKGKANILNFLVHEPGKMSKSISEAVNAGQDVIAKHLRDEYSVGVAQNRTILIEFDGNVVNSGTTRTKAVLHASDKSGDAQIDALVGKLNQLTNQLTQSAVDKRLAASLHRAIIGLKMDSDIRGLIDAIKSVNKQMQNVVEDYEKFKLLPNPSQEQISDFAFKMDNTLRYYNVLKGTYTAVKAAADINPSMFAGVMKDIDTLGVVSGSAAPRADALEIVNNEFTERYTANTNGEVNITAVERGVRTLSRNFEKFSDSVTKATKVLYRIVSHAQHGARSAVLSEDVKLKSLKEAYDKIADKKNYLSRIAQKDSKGNYVHKLIEKYDLASFRAGWVKAVATNDTSWVKDSIDYAAYKSWFVKARREEFLGIDSITYHSDKTENDRIRQEIKDRWLAQYDIDVNVSDNNYKAQEFISDKFISKEFQEMSKQKAALDLWNYIQKYNQMVVKQGLLTPSQARTMLPSIKKNMVEQILVNGRVKFSQGLLESLLSPEDYAAETNIDPVTGMPVERIPFYFTNDLGVKKDNGEVDYSDVSQDIFKLLPLYMYQAEFATRMKPQEAQIRLLGSVEKSKGVASTTDFGEIAKGGGSVDSDTNYKYYWDLVRMTVYGQRDLEGNADQKLVTFNKNINKWLNKTLGTSFNEDPEQVSVTLRGAVKTANKLFQMKVLGLNVFIPIANMFGSEFQAYINAGSEFTEADLRRNAIAARANGWSDRQKNVLVGLADYFQVFVDGMHIDRMSRQLSQNKIASRDVPEWLMMMQSESEVPLQLMFGGAMFDTNMVEDGKIVPIRKFVKSKPEFASYYEKSSAERKAMDRKIDAEIENLMQTRALSKVARFEKGKLVIPDIKRDSPEVHDFINRIHAHVKRATGGGNKDDIRLINGSMIGSSLMIFKSWMPRLIKNRVSGLRHVKGMNDWEMGRYNAVGRILHGNVLKNLKSLSDIYVMNEAGVARMQEVFDKHKIDYEQRTGQPLEMSQREYFDMYQTLIKNAAKDAMIAASLLGLWALAGAMEPPEERKGVYNVVYNLTERFQKEMMFYYDPREIYKTANGSLFPALGVVNDFSKLFKEVGKTIAHKATGDQELKEDTNLFKAVTKPFPILNQSGLLLQIFAEETAKDMGYKDLTPNN